MVNTRSQHGSAKGLFNFKKDAVLGKNNDQLCVLPEAIHQLETMELRVGIGFRPIFHFVFPLKSLFYGPV